MVARGLLVYLGSDPDHEEATTMERKLLRMQ